METERRKTSAILLIGLLSIVVFTYTSCDMLNKDKDETQIVDDTQEEDGEYHSARNSLIPFAENLTDGLPEETAHEVDALIALENMGTDFILQQNSPLHAASLVHPGQVGLYRDARYLITGYSVILYNDGGVNDYISSKLITGPAPDHVSENIFFTNPLKTQPVYFRISHYFKKVWEASLTPSSSVSRTIEETWGTEIGEVTEISETLGLSATATAGAEWGAFSAEVSVTASQELTETKTWSNSITQGGSTSYQLSFDPEEDGFTTLCALWQRVEIFELVDSQGNPWDVSDLGYSFISLIDSQTGIAGFRSIIPFETQAIVTEDRFPE